MLTGTGATVNRTYTAGESITAGQPVYIKAADGKLYKAKASVTSAEAAVVGIALHAAASGQPLSIQTSGQITIGATIAVGVFYYASAAAFGGICPVADLLSTNFVTPIGYGVSTTLLQVLPIPTGAVLA